MPIENITLVSWKIQWQFYRRDVFDITFYWEEQLSLWTVRMRIIWGLKSSFCGKSTIVCYQQAHWERGNLWGVYRHAGNLWGLRLNPVRLSHVHIRWLTDVTKPWRKPKTMFKLFAKNYRAKTGAEEELLSMPGFVGIFERGVGMNFFLIYSEIIRWTETTRFLNRGDYCVPRTSMRVVLFFF